MNCFRAPLSALILVSAVVFSHPPTSLADACIGRRPDETPVDPVDPTANRRDTAGATQAGFCIIDDAPPPSPTPTPTPVPTPPTVEGTPIPVSDQRLSGKLASRDSDHIAPARFIAREVPIASKFGSSTASVVQITDISERGTVVGSNPYGFDFYFHAPYSVESYGNVAPRLPEGPGMNFLGAPVVLDKRTSGDIQVGGGVFLTSTPVGAQAYLFDTETDLDPRLVSVPAESHVSNLKGIAEVDSRLILAGDFTSFSGLHGCFVDGADLDPSLNYCSMQRINAGGDILASTDVTLRQYSSFLRQSDGTYERRNLPEGVFGLSLSDSGIVVGLRMVAGLAKPVRVRGQSIEDLALPLGYVSGKAFDINDRQVTVGSACRDAGASTCEAVLWDARGNVTLLTRNSLGMPGGSRLEIAYRVTNSGKILTSTSQTGATGARYFVLQPMRAQNPAAQ